MENLVDANFISGNETSYFIVLTGVFKGSNIDIITPRANTPNHQWPTGFSEQGLSCLNSNH